MDINIGKILIQPKDNWNATTSYAYLNLVRYNKKLYICKSVTGAPAGTLPTNTSYYMETTQDGIDAQEIQLQKTATEIQWKRTGETTWTTLITLAAIKGDTGAKGDQGLKGDTGAPGEPAHIHIKWHAAGSEVLLDTPDAYIGIYADNTETDSEVYADYSWCLYKGEKGNPAPNTIFQYSVNNIDWTDVATGAHWYRQSGDNGVTWSEAIAIGTTAYADGKITQTITENVTDKAPSEGTVFNALALKADADNVAQLALQLGNPLLALENQNTLAEAIMQNNLNVNSSFDRIEHTEDELVNIEKVVLNAEVSARMSAMRAVQSETKARISAEGASASENASELAQRGAQTAKTAAEAARINSEIARQAAETARTDAQTAKTAAETSAQNAATSERAAQSAQTSAETAQEGAEAARDAASVSDANAQRTYFNVAQLALQLGNPLLALENQNTLAEAILQENLLINNIYDRLEGGIYAAI